MHAAAHTWLISLALLSACRSVEPDAKADSGQAGTTGSDTGEGTTDLPPVDDDADGYTTDVDCDDTDPDIHPDATEICNGIDDDCDSRVDDDDDSLSPVGLRTVYTDADADGYGQDGTETTRCAADAGFAVEAGDCDDTQNSVNPGAEELCGTGLDEDCDGTFGTHCGVLHVYSPDEEEDDLNITELDFAPIETTAHTAKLLQVIAFDLDGDGVDDALVGDWSKDNATQPDGVIHALWGDADRGWHTELEDGEGIELPALEEALISSVGSMEASLIGSRLTTLGDVTGDGMRDLVFTSTYGVWVVEQGTVTPENPMLVTEVAHRGISMWGPQSLDVADAGDIDDDGLSELLVMMDQESGARLFWGSDLESETVLFDEDGLLISQDSHQCRGLGSYDSATGLDLDGDGYTDLVAGCYANYSNIGEVAVIEGAALLDQRTGTVGPTSNDLCIKGDILDTSDPDYLGRVVVPAGDLNHDGYADLAISREDSHMLVLAGSAERFSGSDGRCGLTALQEDDVEHVLRAVGGGDASELAIQSATAVDDITGDGIGDLLVVADNFDNNAGKAILIAGGEGWEAVSDTPFFTMQARGGTYLHQGAAVDLGNSGVPSLVFPSSYDDHSLRVLTVPGY